MSRLLISLFCLSSHCCTFGSGESVRTLDSVRWENRVLAYVISSESERPEFASALDRWTEALEDRDMLLLNLGEIELETDLSMSADPAEKEKWRKRWNIALSETCFVLVGKDGGAKAFQREGLDLPEFFKRIDVMPMRAAELRERGEVSPFQ